MCHLSRISDSLLGTHGAHSALQDSSRDIDMDIGNKDMDNNSCMDKCCSNCCTRSNNWATLLFMDYTNQSKDKYTVTTDRSQGHLTPIGDSIGQSKVAKIR